MNTSQVLRQWPATQCFRPTDFCSNVRLIEVGAVWDLCPIYRLTRGKKGLVYVAVFLVYPHECRGPFGIDAVLGLGIAIKLHRNLAVNGSIFAVIR